MFENLKMKERVLFVVTFFNVILNVVKNLSERIDVRAIVDGCAIPEILRFTQDDIYSKYQREYYSLLLSTTSF